MIRQTLVLLCILGLAFTACNEPELVYEGKLHSAQYIARSWNVRDLTELTFVDGTILMVDNVHDIFTPGKYYYVYSHMSTCGYLQAISNERRMSHD